MVYKSLLTTILLLNLLFSGNAIAQSGKVPPFRFVKPDGKIFKAENLPFNKPIIIIYFSTECEDCQQLIDTILMRINEFKTSSIAMITYFPPDNVSKYVKKNNLDKYPNIYIGTEGNSLFVLTYFQIRKFPFIALYSKNGDLVKKYFDNSIDLDDLILRLKKL